MLEWKSSLALNILFILSKNQNLLFAIWFELLSLWKKYGCINIQINVFEEYFAAIVFVV